MRFPLLAGGLAASLALGFAAPAFAHAHLTQADPAAGATVASPPTELTLTFSEELEPRFCTVVVHDAAGHGVNAGSIHLASGSQTVLQVPVQPLSPGRYSVVWHATSTDTHKTHGTYAFTVSGP